MNDGSKIDVLSERESGPPGSPQAPLPVEHVDSLADGLPAMNPDHEGFVCIHRKIFQNPIAQDPMLFKIWVWCIAQAAWKDHDIMYRMEVVHLKRGQFISGRHVAAKELRCSEQSLRTRLAILEKTQNLTIIPTNRFSLITVLKYDDYQLTPGLINQQINQQPTSNQPASNQQVTTTEYCKQRKHRQEGKEVKQPPAASPPGFDEFWKVFPKKKCKEPALIAWHKRKDKPALEVILAAVKAQAASDQWTKDGGQFIPHPATWLNQGRWSDEVQEVSHGRPGKNRGSVETIPYARSGESIVIK